MAARASVGIRAHLVTIRESPLDDQILASIVSFIVRPTVEHACAIVLRLIPWMQNVACSGAAQESTADGTSKRQRSGLRTERPTRSESMTERVEHAVSHNSGTAGCQE